MKKIKCSIREIRNRNKELRKIEYRRLTEKKLNEKAVKKSSQTKDEQHNKLLCLEKTVQLSSMRHIASGRYGEKTAVKVVGCKSILKMQEGTLVTSFGTGYNTTEEAIIVNGKKNTLCKSPTLDIKPNGSVFEIRRHEANDNTCGYATISNEIPVDLIGAKQLLETRFFGKPQRDNLHIQIIYNILDIEKELSHYVENIIFSINNVASTKKDDVIGSLGISKNPLKSFEKSALNVQRLIYFGNAFFKVETTAKNRTWDQRRTNEEIGTILEIIGQMRQFLKHGNNHEHMYAWLYNFDSYALQESHRKLLSTMLEERIEVYNDNFLRRSGKDITILIRALNAQTLEEKRSIVKSYNTYLTKRKHLRMGVSFKRLRELVTEALFPEFREIMDSSLQARICRLFDFTIVKNYPADQALRVEKKLQLSKNETEKERIYLDEALSIINQTKLVKEIRLIYSNCLYIQQKHFVLDGDINNEWITDCKVESLTFSTFSKLMYLLSLFLDPKESLSMLHTVINKLGTIQGLCSIGEKHGMSNFRSCYSFFHNCKQYIDELLIIESFTRLGHPLPRVEQFMIIEAGTILGADKKTVHSAVYAANMSNEGSRTRTTNYRKDMSLRNFLANKVCNSVWYKYIVRYSKPYQARFYLKNTNLVKFVIGQFDNESISAYYRECLLPNGLPQKEEQVQILANLVSNCTFKMLTEAFRNNCKKDYDEKRRFSAVISLYQLVLYQITKNLVDVNARYSIAIRNLEKDTEMLCGETAIKSGKHPEEDATYMLVDRIIKQAQIDESNLRGISKPMCKYNAHALHYIKINRYWYGNDSVMKCVFREYRNAIAHLSAVTNAYKYINDIRIDDSFSYFSLYHYVMQRYLLESDQMSTFLSESKALYGSYTMLKRKCGYSTDFLWALNCPFAYNLPRYKNLSMRDLFNMHDNHSLHKESAQ